MPIIIISPAANQVISANAFPHTVRVTAVADSNINTDVRFKLNGTIVGIDTSATTVSVNGIPEYRYSFNVPVPAAGIHSIEVEDINQATVPATVRSQATLNFETKLVEPTVTLTQGKPLNMVTATIANRPPGSFVRFLLNGKIIKEDTTAPFNASVPESGEVKAELVVGNLVVSTGSLAVSVSPTPTPTPTPTLIAGPKGDKGDAGTPGVDGVDGADGVDGQTGIQGNRGDEGVPGVKGDVGDRGEKGETGTTGATGERGLPGERGITGDRGLPGSKGDKGDTGSIGLTGARGVAGADGAIGPRGVVGERGAVGEKGATGDRGIQGIQGNPGPAGATGAMGAMANWPNTWVNIPLLSGFTGNLRIRRNGQFAELSGVVMFKKPSHGFALQAAAVPSGFIPNNLLMVPVATVVPAPTGGTTHTGYLTYTNATDGQINLRAASEIPSGVDVQCHVSTLFVLFG